MNKAALVLGAGGFIGSHLVKRLKVEGYWVRGVDLKYPEFSNTEADDFVIADLRYLNNVDTVFNPGFDEVYQLAADMGGAGYIFTGEHDFDVMHNSSMINLHVAKRAIEVGVGKIFYSSSACIYPAYNQMNPDDPNCAEHTAYPAAPDSEYGWEKLFSERMYKSLQRNYGIDVRIARFHNIFGPEGTWTGGREKAPAAICRKVAETQNGRFIDIWGDGRQTRTFLYIDECIEGIRRLMNASQSYEPLNIGSTEMVSINELAEIIIKIANKDLLIKHIDGPQGVRGRSSDNELIYKSLGWKPSFWNLEKGLQITYKWIEEQVKLQYQAAH